MSRKKSVNIFIAGILMVLISPLIASAIMETVYQNEPNFLDLRFSGFVSAFQLGGGLISAFGIVAYFCETLKKGEQK